MALISLPAKFGLASVSLTLQRAGSIIRSRYTGKSQRTIFPYAIWMLEATLIDYPEPEASAIRAFLAKLEGIKNTFKLPVPGYSRPVSDAFYNHLVSIGDNKIKAVTARDNTITLNYAPLVNVAGLKQGEYFNIGDELKMVTSDAVVIGNGDIGFTFQPPVRQTNAAAPIKFLNPYCLMHSDEDDVATWKIKAPVEHSVKISAIEAI